MKPTLDEIEAELRKRANAAWEKSKNDRDGMLGYASYKVYDALNEMIRWLDQQRKETER